jgi:hypothetical protein
MQLFFESVSRLFPPNVAEGDEILQDDGNAYAAAGKETNSSSEDISAQMSCNSSDTIAHLCVNWLSILPNSCDDGQPL